MARKKRCNACQCETYEDEGSYCQDCRAIVTPRGIKRHRGPQLASTERIDYLADRAARQLSLFEEDSE